LKTHLISALAATAAIVYSSSVQAQSESVLYNFPASAEPFARLVIAPNGDLYGTTLYSGDSNQGTVFDLAEKRGKWTEHTRLAFDGNDGEYPRSGLTQDSSGALYGTTYKGGADGSGTVFEITGPDQDTVLYSFTGGSDGQNPLGDLVVDKTTGTIYGTTRSGGVAGCGTVFQLAKSGTSWEETTLYGFQGGADGCHLPSGLHESPDGALFGITSYGGTQNDGTVFELTEVAGIWSEIVLHRFAGGSDGANPSDLDLDRQTGALFGVTSGGGSTGEGTAFELSKVHKIWQETIIFNFGTGDGIQPNGVHLDQATGILYGTTSYGGSAGSGTIFELSPNGGSWTENVLHNFGSQSGDGTHPWARPTEDPTTGYLYGTTEAGGTNNGGTAYEIIP